MAGYGSFDAGQQRPHEDAIFDIGSVTKVFTALTLAEMVLRGEVALDDPAQKYLPSTLQMPKWRGQEITLFGLQRKLLQAAVIFRDGNLFAEPGQNLIPKMLTLR